MQIEKLASLFELLEGWEDRYRQIIDLGKKLEPLDEEHKTAANKVHGCTSQVWLICRQEEDGRLHFVADSDAHIVRGLIAIVLMIFSDRQPEEIIGLDPLPWFARLGLDQHLSPMRSNGLHAMVGRIKALAAAARG
ncbi:MAG: SufE family protein [Planctomycetes bacterium]|nr:SufE family protein [Planctomycetota bacterium]